MAALASLLRRGRRAPAILPRGLTITTSTPASASDTPIRSVSLAKKRLRREQDPDRAVSLLEAIDTASLSAASTRHALSLAARRLSRSRRFADAEALLSSHLPAVTTEPYLAAVLCAYAPANLPEQALGAFRSTVPSLPAPISPLPFNALLSVFLRCHRHNRVPVLFTELSKEFSITPDATSYGILVKAYCMTGDDAKAQQVFDEIRDQGISPTISMYTSLIDSMYKQKKTEEAERLWKEMVENGCEPDVVTYNVKAMYYGLNGKPEEVLEVMAEMEAAGVNPDIISYNFLITCYCRNGKMEDAMRLFHSLGDKGCPGNAATYKHLLASLCANGDFDSGLSVVKESLKRHKVPDFGTMKKLVEGLVKGGRVAEAKRIIVELETRFPQNLMSGWKKLEKELGLNSDSGDTPTEAKSDVAEALEPENTGVEGASVSEETTDDEAPEVEATTSEEVPRGTA